VTKGGKVFERLAGQFDLIIDTVSAPHDYNAYLGLLRRPRPPEDEDCRHEQCLDSRSERADCPRDDDEIDYETTQKGQPFKGSVVSRKSVADLIVKLAQSPDLAVRGSLGVGKL
jgi:hypothetical protein